MPQRPRPILLTILDGWGHSDQTEYNAIHAAATPNWDRLLARATHGYIDTSGLAVGLPSGQMGNSEVGHLNLGAGRVIHQDITRIDQAIATGEFNTNPVLRELLAGVKRNNGVLHVTGLMSPGGVHSSLDHVLAMIRLAANEQVACHVHAILDGRDMPPRSAESGLQQLDALLRELNCGRIVSVIGRYFAMDRDNRWDRVGMAYEMMVEGRGAFNAEDAISALHAAYARNENDEFVQATVIGEPSRINDGDGFIFMNFRADRARQLTDALTSEAFGGFERSRRPKFSTFACLTEYRSDFGLPVVFPPVRPANVLGEFISGLGMKQLRIAETEKYAHVTFFFNGGEEAPFPGEDRILVPSPKVATYDLQPEMSAPEVTDRLVEAIESNQYDLIICNYANADMVGHSGKFDAAVKAVEALDQCIGRLVEALEKAGGEMLLTADHGNVEQMHDDVTGQAHTAHTTNLVPLVYFGRPAKLENGGALADIAPTLLYLMNLEPPAEMTGHSLLELVEPS